MSLVMVVIGLNALLTVGSLAFACLAWRSASRRRAEAGSLAAEIRPLREDADRQSAALREEVLRQFATLSTMVGERLTEFSGAIKSSSENLSDSQGKKLGETNLAVAQLAEKLEKQQVEGRNAMTVSLDKIRESIAASLETLRKENEAKLEQMRLTVDEKLQGTLEKRLGESFKLVSERLETVHKGLGEMQALAIGVGDLKRVLTNVKSRGGWAEVQLGGLLDDMLTPEQFARNVAIPHGSTTFVEYAVKLPGHDAGTPCLVPIDAKFPNEDYERLLAAQELGDPAAVETAAIILEKTLRGEAQRIQKYIHPPETTNFAIMYLPTEGLFAEAIRRPGLMTELQTKWRVNLTGPTTLAAVLSSLRMGFTTLTIQKRSSEVWKVLGEAKAEFGRYGDVWDKVSKQLDAAQKTVEATRVRTRAVERKLRDVEAPEGSPQLVSLDGRILGAPADDDPEALEASGA
ncbi:MAG: DNA recombination protein RmuC [Caulobacteraceae bacterium]